MGMFAGVGSSRSPNGMNGNPDHQTTVQRLKGLARQEFAGQNVEIKESQSIKQWLQIDRRPDVWVLDKQSRNLLRVYEAGRANMSGSPVSRELLKLEQYRAASIPYHFEEVR
jgi:hypothetical protein